MIKSHGDRDWQTATIQLDFQLPLRFQLEYKDKDGQTKTPIVIHRALYGSFERFIAMLLEHGDGHLPVWLSPVQVVVLPISADLNLYGEKVLSEFNQADWRVELWKDDTLNSRIRRAEEMRIPYMLVVGKKEFESNTVTVRQAGSKSQSTSFVATALVQLGYNRDVNF